MLQKLPKPKAVLFDWDNTLVDTWPLIHGALTETFIHMGAEPWSLMETKQKVGKSLRDHFPALFGDNWKKAGDIYTQAYRSSHLQNLTALPYALELLDYLNTQNLFRGVVSNKQGLVLRKESTHMGWDQYFHKLVGASDAKRDKPHADPALLALEGSGIAASPEVWFVGDSTTDIDCALAANLTPILYGNHDLAEIYPNIFHAENHQQLKKLFEKYL